MRLQAVGGSQTRTCALRAFEAREEQEQFGSPPSHPVALEQTQEGGGACVKGSESPNGTSSGCIQDKTVTHCQKPAALPP